jgi:putative ABC transport system substrate-binding protein
MTKLSSALHLCFQLGRCRSARSNAAWQALFALVVALALSGAAADATAQAPAKPFRVGYLAAARGPTPFLVALKDGLRELGLVEGQNLVLEYRSSEDRNELAAMAGELVKLKADAIVASGPAARLLQTVTTIVPIVFGFSGDPVEAGFVNSLARPGTNLTGMSFMAQDLAGKRLELLREVAPKGSRIAIVSTRTHPGEKNEFQETETAARAMKTVLQYLPVTTTGDIDNAFDKILKERAEAVLTFPDAVTLAYRVQIAEFASKHKLPSMFGWNQYVEGGGLMSYGPNLNESYRRLAVFVNKILKGTRPADIPVEQPTKFELVINLKTAKQIGLTIPPNVLARADRVIR